MSNVDASMAGGGVGDLNETKKTPRKISTPIVSHSNSLRFIDGALRAGGGGVHITGATVPSPLILVGEGVNITDSTASSPLMVGGGAASNIDSPAADSPCMTGRTKLKNTSCTSQISLTNQLQHYSIDAVLIDFHMPRMNGPECIEQLRKMGKTFALFPINKPINTHYHIT